MALPIPLRQQGRRLHWTGNMAVDGGRIQGDGGCGAKEQEVGQDYIWRGRGRQRQEEEDEESREAHSAVDHERDLDCQAESKPCNGRALSEQNRLRNA